MMFSLPERVPSRQHDWRRFFMHKYFDQIVGDLTDENIEVKYDFCRVFTAKMA